VGGCGSESWCACAYFCCAFVCVCVCVTHKHAHVGSAVTPQHTQSSRISRHSRLGSQSVGVAHTRNMRYAVNDGAFACMC